MKLRIIAAMMVLMLTGCTNSNGAKRVLEAGGYRKVEITGYRVLTCSEDDSFQTGFRALSPAGNNVTGTVCEGWLKGKTIRLD